MSTYLVTGAAGFIGYHVAQRLVRDGHRVVGIDNLNGYYEVQLKENRLKNLLASDGFSFKKLDLADQSGMAQLFKGQHFDVVIHLAAQAGVRYSLQNPHAYVESNISGFTNILEGCRYSNVPHLVFASSSSVYGANTRMPFSVHQNVDHPLSFYAASKKANELMAHTYAHLFQLPCTGLRFFTVYGPWGRPDMALFLFTRAILEGKPIQLFNSGNMKRDFTYVGDVVEGVVRVATSPPKSDAKWDSQNPDPSGSQAPYKIYNIGNNQPVELATFVEAIEKALGKKAIKEFLPMQPCDVPVTYADVQDLMQDVDFSPRTSVEEGVKKFVDWYVGYYHP